MENLKQFRRLAGLTQVRLARRARISRTRLSFAECGEVELTEQENSAVRRVLRESLSVRALCIADALSNAGAELAHVEA